MTGPVELLAECEALGIRLIPAGEGELTIKGPKGALSPDLIQRLKGQKAALLELQRPTPAVAPPATPKNRPAAGQAICRCGSTRWQDIPIHGGQSLRRDCERCGRFIDFPVWYGKTRKVPRRRAKAKASGLSAAMAGPKVTPEDKANAREQRQDQPWRDKRLPVAERIKSWNDHLDGIATTIRRAVEDLAAFGPMTASQIDVIQAEAKKLAALIRAAKAHQPCAECGGAGCHGCRHSGMLTKRQAETSAARRHRGGGQRKLSNPPESEVQQ
jgi:hypothetical protein